MWLFTFLFKLIKYIQKIWYNVWYSKHIYDTLKPFYVANKIIGLVPYNYEGGQYIPSKFGLLKGILFVVAYTVCFKFVNPHFQLMQDSDSNGDTKIIFFIDTFQWYATVCVTIGLVFANSWSLKIFLKGINEVASADKNMELYGLRLNHTKARQSLTINFMCQLIFFFVLELLNCTLFLTTMSTASTVCYIICCIPLTITCLVKTQFEAILLLLKYRFEAINVELMKCVKSTENSNGIFIKVYPSALIAYNDKRLSSVVAKMRRMHRQLCTAGNYFNNAFGIQNLMIIGFHFISFTAHSYFCIESFIDVYTDDVEITFDLVTTTLWALVKLGTLFHLTLICNQTKDEANLTSLVIHRIRDRFQNETREQIIAFSKQIIQCDLKFTALDCFELDLKMFFVMISSATTYLIILLQMNVALSENFKSSSLEMS